MSDHVKEVSDSSFETEVLKSDQPVLVDFWAAWCAPSRTVTKKSASSAPRRKPRFRA